MTGITTENDKAAEAEQLKLEGNALFQKGHYDTAYDKYTEAIQKDPKNAILYSNRAACGLSMKEYMDASADARKATKLDPKFTKAFGRWNTAAENLGSWNVVKEACLGGLASLPTDAELTPAQKTFKAQFAAGLKKAEAGMNGKDNGDGIVAVGSNDAMPWMRAIARETQMIADFQTNGFVSSGFVIMPAYREFKKAVETMKLLSQQTINGQLAYAGKPTAIAGLTNAILRDKRVFHIDSNDWISKYNLQVMFECQKFKGWSTGGPKVIQDAALKMQKENGWIAVRDALAITVRAWIMAGFIQSNTASRGAGIQFYKYAIDMLDWGRRVWRNVTKEDRGVIFEDTFVRGVRVLYLSAMMEYITHTKGKCEYKLDDVADLARDIIKETEEHPVERTAELDPGFYASFWLYPKGTARSMLGWYHMRQAFQVQPAEDKQFNFQMAATYYASAADALLPDDEDHVNYLVVSLEALWYGRAPVAITLPVAERIRLALPKMKLIWEKAASWELRDLRIKQVLEFEESVQERRAKAPFDMETTIMIPDSVVDGKSANVFES